MRVLLEARGLSFAYSGESYVFRDVGFILREGEIIGIMGESGSGKTTLLNCLSGIIPHVYGGKIEGKALLLGKEISKMRLPEIATKLGVLFQNPDTQLFSGTVEDDVVFGPENLCLPWQELDSSLKKALAAAGISEKRLSSPKSLSGGEAQLAALAASLSLDPAVLLFDEAMSHLDKFGVDVLQNCAVNLKKEGKGLVIVEHDAERLKIADRILRLEEGQLRGGEI
ncbi:MAG: energy-coupling factor ABC transporter ATP-binding protein [Clostridiales bacterium]|nr:energy-coupling factor ABC transporter ATP-binding protein [Clostridiales bacterium]